MTFAFKATSGRTHIGLAGVRNEDRYIIRGLGSGGAILAVADGLGGNVSGGYAADCIIDHLAALDQVETGNELAALVTLVKAMDGHLVSQQEAQAALAGTGSTMVCVLLRDNTAYWIHVGDSRLYLFRDGRLTQITEDQTLARFLVGEGELALKDAATHYSIDVMDQFVGCGYAIPETGSFSSRGGDLLALTTDGLHKSLTPQLLATILGNREAIDQKAERLIQAALKTGGRDNMTIVLAKV
ncbi:PP2C family serine/threonine-protein phosphatase [Desulfosarcina sp.]|uniref:PP2C family protein-serine/threonine phosphatase n=1 Tax=Desulfosarcina sp. TaxID=2027861 RepID=UPI0035622B0B